MGCSCRIALVPGVVRANSPPIPILCQVTTLGTPLFRSLQTAVSGREKSEWGALAKEVNQTSQL